MSAQAKACGSSNPPDRKPAVPDTGIGVTPKYVFDECGKHGSRLAIRFVGNVRRIRLVRRGSLGLRRGRFV